ncbi:cytochrome P450 [Leucogyrophana mollusca]|uniref:Cytochrome P450 n=1 Tax=Leucogyrophana mollusca TaxID=85980 RepID=A0ACB8BMV9_9AGAM|nr:cytochrome P450 [Leucogyrophana mollusca]
MENSVVTYGLAGLVGIGVLFKLTRKSALDDIPTVGPSGLFGSCWGGLKFISNASAILREGYTRYGGKPFKVAVLHQWMVIVSEPKLMEELRKSPDDELSFMEAANDALKIEYTLGPEIERNPYHISIIRSQLTRNLAALYPDIRDEIVVAFDETLQLEDFEWSSVPALDAIQKVICRTSNRLFVGLPLCRNSDWIALNIEFTLHVLKGGIIINFFPEFMAPLVAKFMTNVPTGIKRAMKHLRPIVEERQRYLDEYGREWVDKPNDMLSWLMDEAQGDERSVRLLAQRMLAVNFTAIHSFTQALFNLAANPQYIQPLREEVESVVAKEGWSKGAMVKMRKIDSFLKETQRFDGIGSLTMSRKALKDFTFSDGTFVPKGSVVSVASHAIHHDDVIYENPDVFEPFRFADLREEEGEALKHQMVSTGLEFLPFGHGRHACPGRFFAANELKTMLAHVVVAYDVKLEEGASRPEHLELGSGVGANPKAKVMFRKRKI